MIEKKAFPDPEIISLDTWTITAQTVYDEKGHARVEISDHLQKFQELFKFCLDHECDHARHGPASFWHFWIDWRDRPKLILNEQLSKQMGQFKRYKQDPRLGTQIFYVIYLIYCLLQAIVILAPLTIAKIVIGQIKKRRKK
ncbi:MAG: hypothetical protein MUO31_04865 [Thermodesulfovibrionales bacterium]|nr:hypothetical protein [Thermodesulfovibrionales bacterium]